MASDALRLWTVIPILPHLLFLWLPCVFFLLARRCFVFARSLLTTCISPRKPLVAPPANLRLAIVIPCYNTSDKIRQVVRSVLDCAVDRENILLFAVDSGSTDGTWAVLQELREQGQLAGVAQCGLGRSNALNTGAALAILSSGDGAEPPGLLMFLHSDTLVSRGFDREVRTLMKCPGVAMGYFRFQWESIHALPPMRFNQWYVNKRCTWCQLPWGDQAYFMSTSTFERVGGFPAIPLMEDTALLMACERLGHVQMSSVAISTRPAKFLEEKTDWRCLRQMVRNHLLTVGWISGVISATSVYLRYYKGKPLPIVKTYDDIKAELLLSKKQTPQSSNAAHIAVG